ncbi:uncharacterized protein PgNI_08046 [Pyricularia grisea]|uniref:Uncharacterized protein n=1 Tax=Pyricularia grisea TaxID=148305 RepID=A0A6P8AVH5_PYRGI|nr:uncharacterized protein PgNI_08046 [Pyricularia grisea]TLD06226.1 hypothetical protein PgNI_08046 [Pyricularia grisea]
MKLLHIIPILKAVAILALPHIENRQDTGPKEALPNEKSPTLPSAFGSTDISSTWINCDQATPTIGCFPFPTSSYKTPTLSVTAILANNTENEGRDIVNNYRLGSTSSTKYSFCQAEVVTSYQTFSEGVPTPTTVAVAITQCTQTANTRSVTSFPSSTLLPSTPVVCRTYITTLTDKISDGTTTTYLNTLTSTMTSCGLAKATKTTETSYIPMTIPITLDNSVCFMSTVTSTGLFTAGSDITITMFTAHKPTTTCRPIGWETHSSWMTDNTVTATTSAIPSSTEKTKNTALAQEEGKWFISRR